MSTQHPAFISFRTRTGAVATYRVWSVSAHGWRMEAPDGYMWLTEFRPLGSWESTPPEEEEWHERHASHGFKV